MKVKEKLSPVSSTLERKLLPSSATTVCGASSSLTQMTAWPGATDDADVLVIGSAERTTVRALIRTIADACGTTPRLTALPRAPLAAAWQLQRVLGRRLLPLPGRWDGLDFFLADRTVDPRRALRELGLAARVPLADGIREAVAHARAAGLL